MKYDNLDIVLHAKKGSHDVCKRTTNKTVKILKKHDINNNDIDNYCINNANNVCIPFNNNKNMRA